MSQLKLGLDGALNISDAMEDLSLSLYANIVPPKWAQAAYASRKGLADWYVTLCKALEV